MLWLYVDDSFALANQPHGLATCSGCRLPVLRKWNNHSHRVFASRSRKVHQCMAWSENRQLHTGFPCSLFNSCHLCFTGVTFLSANAFAFLDQEVSPWGCRLLQWSSGLPARPCRVSYVGPPFATGSWKTNSACLDVFGRLSCAE